jgi:hypothetical protein
MFRKRKGCFDSHRTRLKGGSTQELILPDTRFVGSAPPSPHPLSKEAMRPVSQLVAFSRASGSESLLHSSSSGCHDGFLANNAADVMTDPGMPAHLLRIQNASSGV